MMKKLLLLSMCCLLGSFSMAQRAVNGTVTDLAGDALIGVSVTVKEKPTVGVLTDVTGKYTLSVPAEGKTLVFSYTGYTSQEVLIANQSTVNVELEESLTSLNEVVVVGYGSQKKGDITAAISSVSSDELERSTVTSVE
ncbi:MAG: carboxypeptidase-like regulatory domain-containing protein, partial [Spirosomaceae bacterium]|nr:carboxypeptidase-like regulatory domain-containing protein [Spirosomataceae bacterium]